MELMINFDVVFNITDLERILEKLRDGVGIHREVGEILDDIVVSHFDREGTDTTPWLPLSKATIKWRRRMGYNDGPILRASWEMFNSRRYVPSPNNCKYEFTSFKAPIHQYGTNKIPARPFLVVSENERKDMEYRLSLYIFGEG